MEKKVFIVEIQTPDIEEWKEAMVQFLHGFEVGTTDFESKLVEIWTDVGPN